MHDITPCTSICDYSCFFSPLLLLLQVGLGESICIVKNLQLTPIHHHSVARPELLGRKRLILGLLQEGPPLVVKLEVQHSGRSCCGALSAQLNEQVILFELGVAVAQSCR